jgi:ABC-type transport system involved in multi-copper enzyme maturation permease subunit
MKERLKWNMNPIIIKELRSRMRGPRAFITLTVVLVILAAISYALYRLVLATSYYNAIPLSAQVGQTLFGGLVTLELLMIFAVTPAVTAGAISGEQEKLTYEMLLATPLKPASILWGKLVSALSYVLLLLFAGVPLVSLVFIFGGVAPREMIKAAVLLVAIAVFVGVIGIFFSALLKRTGRATVVSYLVLFGLVAAPVFAAIMYAVLQETEPPRGLLIPSPVVAFFSAVTPSFSNNTSVGSLWLVLGGNWNFGRPPIGIDRIPRPLYHYSLPLFGALTLLMYMLATRFVQPTRRWKIGWKTLVAAVVVWLVFGVGVAGAFVGTADRYENISVFTAPTPVPFEGPIAEREIARAVPAPVVNVEGPASKEEVLLPQVPDDDLAPIYAAVVEALADRELPMLFIVRNTDDSIGGSETSVFAPQQLSEDLMDEIISLAAEQLDGTILAWTDTADEILLSSSQRSLGGGGAIITLGNIQKQNDGTVAVAASIQYADFTARGETMILEDKDDQWVVTGNTGAVWESMP